jgi:hypothetical protein
MPATRNSPQHPRVYEMMEEHVAQVNRDLASEEMMAGSQIAVFLVLHKELDADDGETDADAEGAPLASSRALRAADRSAL